MYHIFNIRSKNRDKLKKYLLENGIQTEIHYPLAPNRQKSMKEFVSGDYPLSQKIHETTLSLPISYFHTEEEVMTICKVINRWNVVA